MANQQLLILLKQGVNTWNKWRQEHLDIRPELVAADLQGADLVSANLEGADLSGVHLEGADLFGAYLTRADLSQAYLQGAILFDTSLRGADLSSAHLERANLSGAHLEWADLSRAHLEGAILVGAHLEGAILIGTHLERADLSGAHLGGAHLQQAFFDHATRLDDVTLDDERYGVVSLVDVSWGGVNLTGVDWASVKMLGDERVAHQMKIRATRIALYRTAVRANRQLALVLQAQGLNEEADHFAYHAQRLQRAVWRLQRRPLEYVFSWFLHLYAGYGYRPMRILIAYLLIVAVFARIYYVLAPVKPSWLGALIFSITTFHGRGFFLDHFSFDLETVLAAAEALLGLLMEISFIAILTQRFFRR